MTTARRRDWQSRLSDLIDVRRTMPFAWGVNDCCTFACDAVLEQTGRDPAEGLRSHRTDAEAREVIDGHGGIESLAHDRLGEEIAPAFAAPGDVGYVKISRGLYGLGVRHGEGWLVPGPAGLVALPLDAARTAWKA